MFQEPISAGQPIHSAWCGCKRCVPIHSRDIRIDLGIIGLGVVCALITVGAIAAAPAIHRFFAGWSL